MFDLLEATDCLFKPYKQASVRLLLVHWPPWFLLLRILKPLKDLLAPELVRLLIGFEVVQRVLVRAKPELEAALLDHDLVVELLTLLLRVIEGVLIDEVEVEAKEGTASYFHLLFVPAAFFLLFFFFGVERALIHRETHIGRALVHGKLFDMVANFLNDLNPRGARTDFGHALAFQVDPVLRPCSGVIDVAVKIAQAREWRCIAFTGKSDAGDEPGCLDLGAISALDQPLVAGLVKCCTIHVFIEGDVVSDIPLLLDVIEISSQFFPVRIAILEHKICPQFLVVQLVDGGIGIHPRAWVTIPVPDSAARFPFLKNANTVAEVSESVIE